MQYSDPFITLVNDIGHEKVPPLPFHAHERWLLEVNIDPQDAVLEIRRSLGDRHGTCLRKDCCLTVRRNSDGELVVWATPVALEELGYWPLWDDREARQRAVAIGLPFAAPALQCLQATEVSGAIEITLLVGSAKDCSLMPHEARFRLSADCCTLLSITQLDHCSHSPSNPATSNGDPR